LQQDEDLHGAERLSEKMECHRKGEVSAPGCMELHELLIEQHCFTPQQPRQGRRDAPKVQEAE